MWTYKSCDPSKAWGVVNYAGNENDLPKLRTDPFDAVLSKLSNNVTLGHYSDNDALSEVIEDHSVPVTDKPFIKSISQKTVRPGEDFWIKGTNFGRSQGTSTVMFEDVSLPIISWADTALHVSMPKIERRHWGVVSIRTGNSQKSNELVLHITQPLQL